MKAQMPLWPSGLIGRREQDADIRFFAVGDPVLGAVDLISARNLLGRALQPGRVGARAWLRKREASELFSAGHRREPLFFLGVGAKGLIG